MTTTASPPDTRQQDGFAVISLRKTLFWQVRNTGCGARHIALQDDPTHPLPPLRPPLLLDTLELPIGDLLSVLLAIRKQHLTTLAIVEPSDLRALRLLPLVASVRAILSDRTDLGILPVFYQHLLALPADAPPLCVGTQLLPLLSPPLEPNLLDMIEMLRTTENYWIAGRRYGLSRASVFRSLGEIRTSLRLLECYRPDWNKNQPTHALAARILGALTEPLDDYDLPPELQLALRQLRAGQSASQVWALTQGITPESVKVRSFVQRDRRGSQHYRIDAIEPNASEPSEQDEVA